MSTSFKYDTLPEETKKLIREEFNKFMVSKGRCSSISGMEDDYENGDYYIYKEQFDIWKHGVCSMFYIYNSVV